MKLQYVTFTGPDDKTDPEQLVEFSEKHPHVEWAILFSQSKAGVARYPSEAWVKRLYGSLAGRSINLSAHLCGEWVSDFFRGHFTFFEPEWTLMFKRFQLNMGKSRLAEAFNCQKLIDACAEAPIPAIWGGNYLVDNALRFDMTWFDYGNIHPLIDASGGRGVLPEKYPSFGPEKCVYGFAGGLGPKNIESELAKMALAAGDDEIWIDMESKIRTKDEFDLKLCEKVMKIVEDGGWLK